jgi:hypothetical protein
MTPKHKTLPFLILLLCFLACEKSSGQTKIENHAEYIDRYGISIRLASDLKLIKPIDKNFLVDNFSSRLILPEIDTSKNIQLVISEIKMREKNKSYEVKIISYRFSDQRRPISSPLTRVYEMRLISKNKRFYIKEFNYELMEW